MPKSADGILAILLLSISLEQAQIRLFVKVFCGERGIRTPETLLEFTRFPGVPLQPLEHLSFVATGLPPLLLVTQTS